MNIGIVLSGGIGSRFGSDIPKQYNFIDGKEVVSYVIDAFKKSKLTDEIIVVANEKFIDYLQNKYKVKVIQGGNTRNETVYNAICYIKDHFGVDSKVVFADSARPLLTELYIDDILTILDNYDAVITAAKITDSLYKIGDSIVKRDGYRLIQTPEAFKLIALNEFDKDSQATAIVEQCKSNNICFYDKIIYNMKITYPIDLTIADVLIKELK